MRNPRVAALVVGVLVGGAVAGGIAYAAIPDSTTKQITACVLKAGANKGATRIIDAQRGATCKTTETRIQWAATGANWRGTWNHLKAYEPNDVVYHQGTSYRARTGSINVEPGTSPANWVYLARAGATGPQGPPGADGADGADATLDRPGHTSTDVDDTADVVGVLPSIAIGVDGLPVISHRNATAQSLRITHCDDIACTSATSTTVDDLNDAVGGSDTSIAIGVDGLPVVAHRNTSRLALRVTHCNDTACTTATSTDVDDPADSVGHHPSITIGTDGLPVISHQDVSSGALRVTHCDDVACTSATSTTVDDPANDVGSFSSIATGADGLPVVAHYDSVAEALRVSRCDDLACTTATSTTIDDPANNVGQYSGIAIGSDGVPIISHFDGTAYALRVSHCDDVACTSATSQTVDDPANPVGGYSSIAIDPAGYPIVAHLDSVAGALRITRCRNVACTSAVSNDVDDPAAAAVGFDTSITFGSDGRPIVAHSRLDGALRVTHCSNPFCVPNHRP